MDAYNLYASKCPEQAAGCVRTISHLADISLPVKLEPHAKLGEVKTECRSEPNICIRQRNGCCCELVITQTVCVTIPIEYSASVESCAPYVTCKQCSCDCTCPHEEMPT